MKTLTYGAYLQLEKYHHLDEAIKDLCPELLKANEDLRRKVAALCCARKELGSFVYDMVEPEEWM